MKISIVIPVYNEADRLADCLNAIAALKVAPHEVIVVDNNSTDVSAQIAQCYPFVKLLNEKRQGVVHARTTGFNAATGDIIGRIDADTVLPENWIGKVKELFADKTLSAVSGSAHYYDIALSDLVDYVDLGLRRWLSAKLANDNFLWGANMAVRRSDWLSVKHELCSSSHIHEDFDLGLHLQAHGKKVEFNPNLIASVSSRRINTGFRSYLNYTLVSPRTYTSHNLKSSRYMYPVLTVCWLAYFPGRVAYKGYNHKTGSFSLTQLFAVSGIRIDPTANIA